MTTNLSSDFGAVHRAFALARYLYSNLAELLEFIRLGTLFLQRGLYKNTFQFALDQFIFP
jgi:hypothetical protein